MMSFFNKLTGRSDKGTPKRVLTSDMHAHFLPGIDDGANSIEESLFLIKKMMECGYTKLVATPHVMNDFFKNTPEIIYNKLFEVKEAVVAEGWEIEIAAAAEYYLDEWFMNMLQNNNPLLTFGDRYLLFETSFINQPAQLHEAIFLMQSLSYKPVLAHPERYVYFQDNFEKCAELYRNGVLLQININSLSGYYSTPAQLLAEKLIDKKMVHFAGTDCHALKHVKALELSRTKKYYTKLLDSELLNYEL
jgi:tyrosine-protein phosphatase YwqE